MFFTYHMSIIHGLETFKSIPSIAACCVFERFADYHPRISQFVPGCSSYQPNSRRAAWGRTLTRQPPSPATRLISHCFSSYSNHESESQTEQLDLHFVSHHGLMISKCAFSPSMDIQAVANSPSSTSNLVFMPLNRCAWGVASHWQDVIHGTWLVMICDDGQ